MRWRMGMENEEAAQQDWWEREALARQVSVANRVHVTKLALKRISHHRVNNAGLPKSHPKMVG